MRSSVVVCSFLHFHSLSRENWQFCSVSSFRWTFASLFYQACTLARNNFSSGLLQLASACLAVSFLNPFRLKLLCRAPALCLNEWLLIVLAQGFFPFPLHTWHWKILEIWMNIPLPSRLFPHMVFLMRWQQSCPLLQIHRQVTLRYKLDFLMQGGWYSSSYMDPWPS